MTEQESEEYSYNIKKDIDYDDKQDLLNLYNLPAAIKKQIHTFQGLARGIICDGIINDMEIEAINSWLFHNKEVHNIWPITELCELLCKICEDEVITQKERKELLNFLNAVSCDPESEKVVGNIFTKNANIVFPNKLFLFTGILRFGSRKKAQNEVIRRGGQCADGSYKFSIDYLVIGDLGQDAWKYNRFGAKIQSCMDALASGKANTVITKEIDFIKAVIDNITD